MTSLGAPVSSLYRGDTQVATYVPIEIAEKIDETAHAIGLSRAAWTRMVLLAAIAENRGAEK